MNRRGGETPLGGSTARKKKIEEGVEEKARMKNRFLRKRVSNWKGGDYLKNS